MNKSAPFPVYLTELAKSGRLKSEGKAKALYCMSFKPKSVILFNQQKIRRHWDNRKEL